MRVLFALLILSNAVLWVHALVVPSKNRSFKMALTKRHVKPKGPMKSSALASLGSRVVDLESIYTDVEYVGVIGVGTPPMSFEMILDTGSADIWFPSVPCQSCGNHSLFQPLNSSTFTAVDETWSLQYMDGSYAQGVVGKDVIHIGDLAHKDQTIGLATQESRSFAANDNMDGVFGLSFPSVSFTHQKTSVVMDMYNAGEIDEPVVGMYLGRTRDGGHGEAIFGGVNPDNYTGNLTYLQVTRQKYWQVDFGGIEIDGTYYPSPDTTQVMIDTGTTLAVIPSSLAKAIHQAIPGGKYVDSVGWFFPCDTNATVTVNFKLGGHDFPIRARELLRDRWLPQDPSFCITGLGEDDSGLAIMGETFLRNFYSSYNFKDAVVGLAAVHS